MAKQERPGPVAGDDQFSRLAESRRTGIVRELLGLLGQEKKFWLAPFIGVLLLVGLLLVIGGTGAAPFIYALF